MQGTLNVSSGTYTHVRFIYTKISPDLTVPTLSLSDSSGNVVSTTITAGNMTLSGTVRNDGGATASGSFNNPFYFSTDGSTFSEWVGNTLSNLASGVTGSVSYSLFGSAAPSYWFRLCADSGTVISESNASGTGESNNCRTIGPITITEPPSTPPTAPSISGSAGSCAINTSDGKISLTLGTASTGATSYNLYRKLTSTASFSGTPTVTGVTFPYTDNTLNVALDYDYQLKALGPGGSTLSSVITTKSYDWCPPGTPSLNASSLPACLPPATTATVGLSFTAAPVVT